MKKIIFSLILSLCILSGCTDDSSKDYKRYRVRYTMANGTQVEGYRWMNKETSEWQKERYRKYGYTGISITRDISKNSFAECWDSDTATHICGKQPGSNAY